MVVKNSERLPKGARVTPSVPGGLHVQAVCAKPSLNVHQHTSSHEAGLPSGFSGQTREIKI